MPQSARVPMLVVIGFVGLGALLYGLTGGRWWNLVVGVCLLAVVAIDVYDGRRAGAADNGAKRP